MLNARLSSLVGFVAVVAGCSSATVANSPSPAVSSPSQQSVKPGPVGYQPQFGTMWTFDAPPIEYWKKTYGFAPDQKWLDHVRLSTIRLPNCSASFVSANGLVMTNHHCARECTDEVSPKDSNY